MMFETTGRVGKTSVACWMAVWLFTVTTTLTLAIKPVAVSMITGTLEEWKRQHDS